MTIRYYAEELRTSTERETIDTECPVCHGSSTEYLRFDDSIFDGKYHEIYICYDCQREFDDSFDIPF